MKSLSISDDVRRFILSSIPSVPYLEALLLMRSLPEHQWSVGELSERLFIKESATEAILKQLSLTGVIKALDPLTPLFQYHPHDKELNTLIDQLAATYTTNLIEVTNLIHSNIEKKAQKFSDAFIWRKDS